MAASLLLVSRALLSSLVSRFMTLTQGPTLDVIFSLCQTSFDEPPMKLRGSSTSIASALSGGRIGPKERGQFKVLGTDINVGILVQLQEGMLVHSFSLGFQCHVPC